MGAQLHYRGDADEAQRDGTGELLQIRTFLHTSMNQDHVSGPFYSTCAKQDIQPGFHWESIGL